MQEHDYINQGKPLSQAFNLYDTYREMWKMVLLIIIYIEYKYTEDTPENLPNSV